MMDRIHTFKTILWSIIGLAAAVGITRFLFGLGATTNLTDATPWGFWIGFDVMGGVALASGGFVITAMVYIMKREEFHPIVKPAVLTAFLGYIAVIAGLMFDLGLPWNIWHMMVYWNPHSPLFEVGWCVMLYTTVLLLEFSPVPLEKFSRWAKIRKVLMKFRLPLVGIGIALSTLHQSSLGSLFLIMPFKMHPLWYSNFLPIIFFLSAIALGLGMVSLESLVSSFLYRRKPEIHLISKLTKVLSWVLSIYFVTRLADIVISGKADLLFAGDLGGNLFIVEISMIVIIPIILFSISRIRQSLAGLWFGAILVVLGIVFNRINVGGLSMLQDTGSFYIPSWMELTISAGVVSFAALIFFFAVEKFNIWEHPPVDPEAAPHKLPEFDHTSEVWLGSPRIAAITKYSLAFVIAAAIGFMLIPGNRLYSSGADDNILVQKARGGDTLFVDGNRDGFGVSFNHAAHEERNGGKQSCVICHHMNLPADQQSGCFECHSSMYYEAEVFQHDWHSSPEGANLACSQCHNMELERDSSSAKECKDCHKPMIAVGSTIEVKNNISPSYTDVMHSLCATCHEKKAIELADTKPRLGYCATCHESVPPEFMNAVLASELQKHDRASVVLPNKKSNDTEQQPRN